MPTCAVGGHPALASAPCRDHLPGRQQGVTGAQTPGRADQGGPGAVAGRCAGLLRVLLQSEGLSDDRSLRCGLSVLWPQCCSWSFR